MPTERVIERPEPTEREVVVERGGSGVSGVIIGIAVLALVAIIAFFLIQSNRNDAVRTDAVTSAASSVAGSASNAADSVANAAGNVGDAAGAAAQNAGDAAGNAAGAVTPQQ
jgi:hypothetical protein